MPFEELVGQVPPLVGRGAREVGEDGLVGSGFSPHPFEYSGPVIGVVE
jgi:hypothetical protein